MNPILIDVDGVVADFHGPVIDYIFDRWGIKVSRDEITGGDIRKYAQGKWDDEAEGFILSDGFAQTLKPFPGAIEAIKSIMENNEVVFVTAPYLGSKTWDHDRREWLKHHFDINRDQLIFAHNKAIVSGMTIIDDKWETIVDWSHLNKKTSICFQQPWNTIKWGNLKREDHNGVQWFKYKTKDKFADFFVANGWAEVPACLEKFKEYREVVE